MDGFRVGLIGSGGIAEVHATALVELGAEVGLYSPDVNAGAFAAEFGLRRHDSLDGLLAAVDVVDVCAPTYVHRELVEPAAAAGCHVICEKPLALTREDAQAMIAACRAAGVGLYPGQVVRYFPEYAAARALVAEGRIGQPAVLRLSRRGAKPAAAWFGDETLSGGVIVDQMIHDFDYARWLAGEVRQVDGHRVVHSGGLELAHVVLTHADGAVSWVHGGWSHPWTSFETSLSIAGSAGEIEHSSQTSPALRWDVGGPSADAGSLLPGGGDVLGAFRRELADFLAAVRTGATPRVTAEDGLAALEIAVAAAHSARIGEPVVLDDRAAAAS